MKYYETHFEDYLLAVKKFNLHEELNDFTLSLPDKLEELKNTIIYGPPGIGKYSQVLNILKKYSQSDLKYEKKITVQTDKQDYIYKISDIHFEIDMSLLGCNSKILWNEIFLQIVDIISVKQEKIGIILCKNFHLIHNELLEIFYSYMQQYYNHKNIKIKFFILTEQLSFIPNNLINMCYILRIKRPKKEIYLNMIINNKKNSKLNTEKFIKIFNNIEIDSIVNIKELQSFFIISSIDEIPNDVFNTVCNNILENIIFPKKIEFTIFRDCLYDILTYNLDMSECLWYILKQLIYNNHLKKKDVSDILIKSFYFFKYYNNNYRPIYHLESILFYIINKIHGFNEI
jgi:hypothetical protein